MAKLPRVIGELCCGTLLYRVVTSKLNKICFIFMSVLKFWGVVLLIKQFSKYFMFLSCFLKALLKSSPLAIRPDWLELQFAPCASYIYVSANQMLTMHYCILEKVSKVTTQRETKQSKRKIYICTFNVNQSINQRVWKNLKNMAGWVRAVTDLPSSFNQLTICLGNNNIVLTKIMLRSEKHSDFKN